MPLRSLPLLALPMAAVALPGGPQALDPTHVFSLRDLGLDELFKKESIAQSFDNLVPDAVSVDANGESMCLQRQRRYGAFDLNIANAARPEYTTITFRPDATSFAQEVDDFRNSTRTFELMEPEVRESQFLSTFIRTTAAWAAAAKFGAHATNIRANVSVHQVRQVVMPGGFSDNAPEGVHRDGADFIVSALVLGKHNVVGGKSTVFAPDKQEVLLEHTLETGYGIFHEDRELWHDITKVYAGPKRDEYGHRDIIGLDIILSRESPGYGRGCAE